MPDPDAYVALVSSLPSSERLFVAKQPPLSRLRLERRLTALSHEDRATLRMVEGLLGWKNYSMSDNNAISIGRARHALTTIESDTIRAILVERLDLRVTIAALRMRRDGHGPPAKPWGLSRLSQHIIANWSDPTFALNRRMPWVVEAVRLFDAQDPLGLERHIIDVTFRQLLRHGAQHHFDFEAVVIYVLKWSIFDRWSRSDARAASSRFETLVQTALSEFDGHRLEGAT